LPQGSESGVAFKRTLTPKFAAYAYRFNNLLAARTSNNLANFLNVLADAGDGIAASNNESDECESDCFFHGIPMLMSWSGRVINLGQLA
jgi:hypothetical protein